MPPTVTSARLVDTFATYLAALSLHFSTYYYNRIFCSVHSFFLNRSLHNFRSHFLKSDALMLLFAVQSLNPQKPFRRSIGKKSPCTLVSRLLAAINLSNRIRAATKPKNRYMSTTQKRPLCPAYQDQTASTKKRPP